jgi:hypothetical protein
VRQGYQGEGHGLAEVQEAAGAVTDRGRLAGVRLDVLRKALPRAEESTPLTPGSFDGGHGLTAG